MLSETIKFNVGVLVAHGGPYGKTTTFPLITCRNETVEIAAVGVTLGITEKSIPVRLIIVKNPGRGRVDVEPASERGRVGADCSAINVERGIYEISTRLPIPTSQVDRKVQ